MRSVHRAFLSTGFAAACFFASAMAEAQTPQTSAVSNMKPGETRHYYPTSKPMTRWWWFASRIQDKDVEAQLRWLKTNNFGGVEIAWVYPLSIPRFARFYPWITEAERKTGTPRQEWLSPEWSRVVGDTKRSCDRLGLQCDFTFGSAWPFGDSLVSREDATKTFGSDAPAQRNLIPWEYPEQGAIINHLDRRAFARYADRMGRALADGLRGSRSGLFCDSWEVNSDKIWTAGFERKFEARFGYDIRPHMPTIFDKGDPDFRYDYLSLVSDLVLDEFYGPFVDKCHALQAFSRVQCAGAPTDLLSAYAMIDVPESEALLYDPLFSRIPAAAAAFAGNGDVTAETFTCLYGFPRKYIRQEQAADLKLLADSIFANGVNHIIWHGKPFNPEGSDRVEFYASVHVGPDGKLSPELPGLNLYLAKVSAALKEGRTYSNVAQYMPMEDGWMRGLYPVKPGIKWMWGAYELRDIEPAKELAGHHPLWINHRFLKQGRVQDKKLHVGDLTFSALYVNVKYLDAAALQTILKLARQGLPVCVKQRPLQPGKNKSSQFDKDLNALLGLANVSQDFAKLAIGRPLVEGQDLPEFWCRVKNGAHVIFFAHPMSKGVRYPMQYGQSFSNKTIEIPLRINLDEASVDTRLVFRPYQSILLEVDGDGTIHYRDIDFVPKTPATVLPPD